MPTSNGQKIKLKVDLESFERNLERMRKETAEEMDKILTTGASAYATSASKHSPPDLGKPVPDKQYYVDGVWYRQSDTAPLKGKRPVYDLLELVRNSNSKFRPYYGRLVRQGYLYMVKIFRQGKRPVRKFCKTMAEAERYAHESYRGLTRAAWGLQFSELSGKMPPAFRKYVSERPELSKMASLNKVGIQRQIHEVTITNEAIRTGASFLGSTDTNASIAAVRSMNDRINKFMKKKYDL